jgi:hypothetical protein
VGRAAWLKVTVVLVVVVCGSLLTARAQQVSAENRAHAQLLTAEKAAYAHIARAAAAGLTAREIAPFRSQADALSRADPPSSLPVLSSSVSAFYDRQARSFQALGPQIRREVRRTTLAARSQVWGELGWLKARIAWARSLDVAAGDAQRVLTLETGVYRHGAQPRDFRAIPPVLSSAGARVAATARSQAQYVSGVLSAAHDDRAGVLQRADLEAASADHPLSLLALITDRAVGYRAAIRDMLAGVHAASSAFAAAVKESHLHQEVSQVNDDYARTVPSRMIVVSTEQQTAWLYQDGQVIYSTLVTTGGPELPTDHGVFHINWKQSPFTFHSPWPPSSPFYYPPTQVQYWMPFDGGEGLHDASWRSDFGPGSNLAPTDLGTGNSILGTHGCVNLPFAAAQMVWDWASVGTMVVVV